MNEDILTGLGIKAPLDLLTAGRAKLVRIIDNESKELAEAEEGIQSTKELIAAAQQQLAEYDTLLAKIGGAA